MSHADAEQQKQETEKRGFMLSDLKAEVQRVFDNYLKGPLEALGETYSNFKQFYPAVDIAANEDTITVCIEVAGVQPDQLELNVTPGALTIRGTRSPAGLADGAVTKQNEIRWGSFSRTVPISSPIDTQRVVAEFKNGLLTVHLKKTGSSTVEKVPIVVT